MNLRRAYAVFLRQTYLIRGSMTRVLPLFAWVIVAALYVDAWESPQWAWHLRTAPLAPAVRYGIPLVLLPGLVLTLEELWRCRRSALIASAARAAPSPSPGAAP